MDDSFCVGREAPAVGMAGFGFLRFFPRQARVYICVRVRIEERKRRWTGGNLKKKGGVAAWRHSGGRKNTRRKRLFARR